jgi:MFS transporter, ACS family, hexuronate transporter
VRHADGHEPAKSAKLDGDMMVESQAVGSRPRRLIRHLRWWIIAACFLSTMVNYIDRQCLSVAAPTLCKEFDFSSTDYATIVNSFLAAYAVMQFVSGRILDKIGVRWGMAVFAAWWSVAGAIHAFCGGLWSFRAARFALGMGEAGNWPAATKAVSEWFPARERALAVAIFDSGSSVEAVLAAPLVAWLILAYGWQSAFLVTGVLAASWIPLWLWIYQRPERHGRIEPAELELLRADRPRESQQSQAPEPLLSLLACPQVWGIVLGRFLTDCVWWFYVYWLPKYLSDARGFSLQNIAMFAWIPFVAADLGNFGGGGLSSYLLRGGWTLNAARKSVLVLSAIGMLAGVPAGLTSQAGLSLALIGVATFGVAAWGTMMLTLPTDLFSSRDTGSVSGMTGTGAGLGGLAFTAVTGAVVDRFSYMPVFLMAGLMPIAALAIIQWLIPQVAMTDARRANA